MRSIVSRAGAGLLLLLLGACQTSAVPARLDLPALAELDRRLTDPNWCGRGDARSGESALVAAKRKEDARRCEAARAAAWGVFYRNLYEHQRRIGGRRGG
jgi:hypothetical protein